MNLHKRMLDLMVGDECYLLKSDWVVEIVIVTEILESIRASGCMKIRFSRLLPDLHVDKSANMVFIDTYMGNLYLEKALVLEELSYRRDVITKSMAKLNGEDFPYSSQQFNSQTKTNTL